MIDMVRMVGPGATSTTDVANAPGATGEISCSIDVRLAGGLTEGARSVARYNDEVLLVSGCPAVVPRRLNDSQDRSPHRFRYVGPHLDNAGEARIRLAGITFGITGFGLIAQVVVVPVTYSRLLAAFKAVASPS